LTYELIRAYGLLDMPSVQFVSTIKADEDDLSLFHSREYLNILKQGNGGLIGILQYEPGLSSRKHIVGSIK